MTEITIVRACDNDTKDCQSVVEGIVLEDSGLDAPSLPTPGELNTGCFGCWWTSGQLPGHVIFASVMPLDIVMIGQEKDYTRAIPGSSLDPFVSPGPNSGNQKEADIQAVRS